MEKAEDLYGCGEMDRMGGCLVHAETMKVEHYGRLMEASNIETSLMQASVGVAYKGGFP